MSTHLVASIVGELECIERTATTGNKIRVYCEVGKTKQGTFALDDCSKNPSILC
jgi:puromycin-sensitive aminopeptidase